MAPQSGGVAARVRDFGSLLVLEAGLERIDVASELAGHGVGDLSRFAHVPDDFQLDGEGVLVYFVCIVADFGELLQEVGFHAWWQAGVGPRAAAQAKAAASGMEGTRP